MHQLIGIMGIGQSVDERRATLGVLCCGHDRDGDSFRWLGSHFVLMSSP